MSDMLIYLYAVGGAALRSVLPSGLSGIGDAPVRVLVADRLHDSVRWQPPPDFARLPTHGFDAVHLLLHPGEVHTAG